MTSCKEGYMWGNMASAYLGNDGIDVLVCDSASTAAEDHLSSVPHHGQQVVLVHGGLVV